LEQSLLDIKRGVAMKNKTIKESKTVTYTDDVHPVVEQMESEWPEMTKEFKKIQQEQYELFLIKQRAYGPSNISVGTQLKTDADIKLSLTGLFFRINDKIERIKNMIMNDIENNDEPLEDSFLDLSTYGIIAEVVRRRRWGK